MGGCFRSDLQYARRLSPVIIFSLANARKRDEKNNNGKGASVLLCRQDLNDPPTAETVRKVQGSIVGKKKSRNNNNEMMEMPFTRKATCRRMRAKLTRGRQTIELR